MTLHPHGADAPADPLRAFEDAARAARASSHSRRLDTAVQSALNAYADSLTALMGYARARDADLAALSARLATLEAFETQPILSDP
jgi:hypothetical protein